MTVARIPKHKLHAKKHKSMLREQTRSEKYYLRRNGAGGAQGRINTTISFY